MWRWAPPRRVRWFPGRAHPATTGLGPGPGMKERTESAHQPVTRARIGQQPPTIFPRLSSLPCHRRPGCLVSDLGDGLRIQEGDGCAGVRGRGDRGPRAAVGAAAGGPWPPGDGYDDERGQAVLAGAAGRRCRRDGRSGCGVRRRGGGQDATGCDRAPDDRHFPMHAGKPDVKHMDRWFAPTIRLRTEGTDHLLAAAEATGVSRVVAQSYASWNGIREGGWVKTEEDPLDLHEGTAAHAGSVAIRYLEDVVVKAGGAVLRYGGLYGPGATDDQVELVRKRQFPLVGGGTGYCSWVHLDDAASATVLAVEQQARGVFNIVDDEPAPAGEWLPYLAACAGAKPPRRVPTWLARLLAGDVAVIMMTEGRGFSNAKAKRELGWQLRYPSWRQGFAEGLA